jgi:hypothetical protein
MQAAGHDVHITWNYAVETTPIPREQADAYQQASEECSERTGAGQRVFTENDHREIYALELEQQACLRAHGVETSEPPSIQTFLDDFDTAKRWNAMSEVDPGTMPRDEYETLFTECPSPMWIY